MEQAEKAVASEKDKIVSVKVNLGDRTAYLSHSVVSQICSMVCVGVIQGRMSESRVMTIAPD
jgi:hypothetical protein